MYPQLLVKGPFVSSDQKTWVLLLALREVYMVHIKISKVCTKKQRLQSPLKDSFYSSSQAAKQILTTDTQGGSNVLKHGYIFKNGTQMNRATPPRERAVLTSPLLDDYVPT